ncbi:MAG: SUMF1/EgtB/PvdO family nonheme iron enzyme, partial [Phycisphaerae bacterium]
QNNVIHRDLKPSNILVTETGQPKILDFGVARVTDGDIHAATLKTDARKLIGTLPYMSPEQITGDPRGVDVRSDVYALGVLGYRMLAGRYPLVIPRNSIPEAIRVIQVEEPTRLRFLNRELRGDAETIILKALEKDRSRRYQSAAEFAADIRRYLNEEPIRARPASNLYRFRKFARRNKALVGGITGVMAALLIGLIVSTRAYHLADQRLEDFRRLADARELDRLLTESDRLWPSEPGNIAAMESWLEKAEALRPRLHEYRLKLIALHELPPQRSNLPQQLDRTGRRVSTELAECRRALGLKSKQLAELTAKGSAVQASAEIARLQDEIRQLVDDERELAARIPNEHICLFEDGADQLEHDVLDPLVQDLDAFFHPATGAVTDVRRRLKFAKAIRQRSIDQYQREWKEAVQSIADRTACPQYNGLVITPQIGLVPIGRNPDSRLWEFAHLQTGDVPSRGPDQRLSINDETGLVFVLIPGGTFQMGTQSDSTSHEMDGSSTAALSEFREQPVHTVSLDPFFLSKYEMTQGQWLRATGKNPSALQSYAETPNGGFSPSHPVESISWTECDRTLWRLGLALPTEAQWEYAARAGTVSPWWTGEQPESLRGAANLADRSYAEQGGPRDRVYEKWLSDGHAAAHAPVGTYRANPFGLHDVAGNVAEWCLDALGDYTLPVRPGNGRREAGRGLATHRVIRGGSFESTAEEARSAKRAGAPPESRRNDLGVRPARRLETP